MKQKTELKQIKQTSWVSIRNQQLSKEINKYMKKRLISEQKEILKEYKNFITVLNGRDNKPLSLSAILNRIKSVYELGELIKKPFNTFEQKDIITFVAHKRGEGFSNNTINLRLMYLKCFFDWLGFPNVMKGIKTQIAKKQIRTDELLTQEDIKKLINVADGVKHKAFISVLYDSGARVSEILNAKIRHLRFDEYGGFISVEGKTGFREIRLIDSIPYLQEWINQHPYKDNIESPLFIARYKLKEGINPMTYSSANDMLIRAKRKSGINKPCNAHHFRHSKLNAMGEDGFNDRDLRIFAGWDMKSPMPSIYTHYKEKELDKKMLHKRGLIKEADMYKDGESSQGLKPIICSVCSKINPATNVYCDCGTILNEEKEQRKKADEFMNMAFNDPEFIELFKSYMKKKQTL